VGACDAGGCLQAVKPGHAHVHHHHVGLESGGHGDGVPVVGGLADDRQAVVLQQARSAARMAAASSASSTRGRGVGSAAGLSSQQIE